MCQIKTDACTLFFEILVFVSSRELLNYNWTSYCLIRNVKKKHKRRSRGAYQTRYVKLSGFGALKKGCVVYNVASYTRYYTVLIWIQVFSFIFSFGYRYILSDSTGNGGWQCFLYCWGCIHLFSCKCCVLSNIKHAIKNVT